MKTDELVTLLAGSVEPVERNATTKRFRFAMLFGVFLTTLAMVFTLGIRPDVAIVVAEPMFWVKLLFPAAVAAVALYASMQLARPGMKPRYVPQLLIALLVGVWVLAGVSLVGAAPVERRELVFGHTWLFCLVLIPLLAIPTFITVMWAMKGLAPIQLRSAGTAAGLLSGAVSAAVYALHCPELGAPFIAIWYVLGMSIPALVGSLIGPRLLHW